jgi:hypothetical protein
MNKYLEVLKVVAEILEQKNKGYGKSYDKTRDEYGIVSFHVQLSHKFNRLKELSNNADNGVSDIKAVEDSIRDIIGYCALELIYMDNVQGY